MTRTRRHLLRAVGTGLVVGVAGCSNDGDASPEEQAQRHRETLSKYTDVAVALEDGYEMTTPYVRTEQGVLGVPFVNMNVPELEPEQPNVLFYNVRDDGTYELLGVEWLVRAESADSPPSMFGREFEGPTAGETDFIPEHYGLHAWLFEDNPDGTFARYHGSAEPPSFIDELETAWDALSSYYSNEAAAEDAGYAATEDCIATEDGGLGIPFVNTDFTGTDPSEPAVLLYRLSASWTYQLIGAEWYVPADSSDGQETLFGRELEGPMDGHSDETDQPEHRGLHAWLFTGNPDGMFARHNPIIEC